MDNRMCQHCEKFNLYPFRPEVAARVIPPGFTVNDWTQYINTYIDVRIRGLYDRLVKCLPTERMRVLLRDQADLTRIFKLFIQQGVICTEEVQADSTAASSSSSLINSSSSSLLTTSSQDSDVKDFLQFNDVLTGELVNVYVYNGQVQTSAGQRRGSDDISDIDELHIDNMQFDNMDVKSLKVDGKPIDEYVQGLIS